MSKKDDRLQRDLNAIRSREWFLALVAVALLIWLGYSFQRGGHTGFVSFYDIELALALGALWCLSMAPSQMRMAKRLAALEQAVAELQGKVPREP
jgi:hypothetical protein